MSEMNKKFTSSESMVKLLYYAQEFQKICFGRFLFIFLRHDNDLLMGQSTCVHFVYVSDAGKGERGLQELNYVHSWFLVSSIGKSSF